MAKHGLKAEVWGPVAQQEVVVTAGLIEQRLALGRVDEAVRLYRSSAQFQTRTKAAFHVQVRAE